MFRVLVIDGEPALLELTKAWLARSGEMQVETATLIVDWKELLEVLAIGGERQADVPARKNRWSGFRPYLRPYFLNIYQSPAATPAITKRPSNAT